MDPVFPFPFKPYDIQEHFMKELYFTIENSKSGIFESPTGTGKSLSICCGTLQWLKDHNEKVLNELEREIKELKTGLDVTSATDDWLTEEYEKVQKKQKLATLQTKLDKIKQRTEYFKEIRTRVAHQKTASQERLKYLEKVKLKDIENKENEREDNTSEIEEDRDMDLILDDDKESSDDDDEEDEEEEDDVTKIYISSRTHSQLSQFVGEIKRTIFKDDTRVVTLASRQHYCINSEVSRLKNINLINERCLDLQKSKSKTSSMSKEGKALKKTKTKACNSCQYYNQSNISKLKDRMLVDVMDMEDFVKCGKELKACPYYASRLALKDAQVVLVSHAGVVSSGARAGSSLKLQNNVLIMDEAHGLTAALESAHSAPISRAQLTAVKSALKGYAAKYRARLSSKNLLALNQLGFVVGRLLATITAESSKEDKKIYTIEDFVIKAEIDNMNLRPLVEFARNTRLAPKLHSFSQIAKQVTEDVKPKKSGLESFLKDIAKKKEVFVEETKVDDKSEGSQPKSSEIEHSPATGLYSLLELLKRLCERSADGRVLAHASSEGGHLRYLLLNPSEHFADVVRQCRSVIVAGGTMEPISEFQALLRNTKSVTNDVNNKNLTNQSEHDVTKNKDNANDVTKRTNDSDVTVVRCGHVVPPENVLGVCLTSGPTGKTLNFSYDNRGCSELLDELGRIVRNLCSIVPGGVVCFFPSYSYEQSVFEHWKRTNALEAIAKKKQLFREPKSAGDVDQVLSRFAAAAMGGGGALLLGVVGGKLSEGLNFSDELGRCVIVVGMPYPNKSSPEVQEKLAHLNRSGASGAAYYENLCMKAVNQCIGRAVRHARDYACVALVDERYSRPNIVAALPSFIQTSLIPNMNFGPTIGQIAKFFARHKNKV